MLKNIEIDIEVYKRIESERIDFVETHNDILRRLLNVDCKKSVSNGNEISNKMVFDLDTDPQSSFYPNILEEEDDIASKISQYQRTIMENRLNALMNEPPSDWIFEGVRLPEGTKLRKWYRGQQYYAVIANGSISFGGKLYYAPSAAAMAITNGSPVNGWLFWEYFDETDASWKKLTELREDTIRTGADPISSTEKVSEATPKKKSIKRTSAKSTNTSGAMLRSPSNRNTKSKKIKK